METPHSNTNSENNIISLLKKIFTIKVLGFIVAIGSFIVALIALWYQISSDNDSNKLLISQHNTKIELLEKLINENLSVSAPDSIEEVILIKKSINKSNIFVNICRANLNEYNTTPNIETNEELANYLLAVKAQLGDNMLTSEDITNSFIDLLSSYPNPDYNTIYGTLVKSRDIKSNYNVFAGAQLDCAINYFHNNDRKNCLNCINKLFNSPENIEYLNSTLDECITMNKVFYKRLCKIQEENSSN